MCRIRALFAVGILAALVVSACERVTSDKDVNARTGPAMMQMMHPESPDDRSSTAVDSGLVK